MLTLFLGPAYNHYLLFLRRTFEGKPYGGGNNTDSQRVLILEDDRKNRLKLSSLSCCKYYTVYLTGIQAILSQFGYTLSLAQNISRDITNLIPDKQTTS
jgi:hypothetical protein